MDRDEFMELIYETFAEEPDNVLANGIIEAADAYVEYEKAQLSQEGTTKDTTSDLISRQDAIDAVRASYDEILDFKSTGRTVADSVEDIISELPPAQPEPTGINAKEAVYNLAEKIGIHQLFALTVELRGEPIQPEPQEGHWINGKCDRCGEHAPFWAMASTYHESNFCPNCGAKMKGERQK